MAGFEAASFGIYARRFDPTAGTEGTWEAPVAIGTQGYPAVELGADAAGNALVGLRNNDASGMIYRRYAVGSGWDGASSNVAGFNFSYNFDWTMAMGTNGTAVAITDDETRILGVHF